jgi:diguanylate cyclase (GGDEF)-like protein
VTLAVALLAVAMGAASAGFKPLAIASLVAIAAGLGHLLAARERRLRALGATDQLTGLFNRRHLSDCLDRELALCARYPQPLALLVIDVDALKAINDTLGHRAGDDAICTVARALETCCRATDLAVRWGGDEFVVMAPHTDHAQATALSARIGAAVKQQSLARASEARLRGLSVAPSLSVSAGISIATADRPASLWPGTLFSEADRAMYEAKASRRSTQRATVKLPGSAGALAEGPASSAPAPSDAAGAAMPPAPARVTPPRVWPSAARLPHKPKRKSRELAIQSLGPEETLPASRSRPRFAVRRTDPGPDRGPGDSKG